MSVLALTWILTVSEIFT